MMSRSHNLLSERDAAIARAEKAEAERDRLQAQKDALLRDSYHVDELMKADAMREEAESERDRERALADRLAEGCLKRGAIDLSEGTRGIVTCRLCTTGWWFEDEEPEHESDCPVAAHAAARKERDQ
jgi:hypothetical protein